MACAVALLAAPAWVHADPDADVRQIWQLLDYLAVDYAGAVVDGAVRDETEYREMQEFAATAGDRIALLPARDQQQALVADAGKLQAAIAARTPPAQVADIAHRLADALLSIYPVQAAPDSAPSLARGAELYESRCAGCHGPGGRGDGPLARSLEPPPIAFTNAARARERSPLSLYQTISLGVAGTSMAGFESLPEADRWALAFFVGGLSYTLDDRREGERLWKGDDALRARFPSLEAVSRTTESNLSSSLDEARARALTAYLRPQPSAIQGGGLALSRSRLRESLRAYENGDAASARRLALSAYLDGFEPIEPQLSALDPELLARVETEMAEYGARIERAAPPPEVAAQVRVLTGLLDATASVLASGRGDRSAAFIGSLTILVREGLEALLIVIAIVAFLRKANRRDVLPFVHAGWLAALGAGAITWAAATFLVSISGTHREVTEGVSSLFAALVLLSVGLWMHGKSLAGRWQRYIDERMSHVLSGRSAWLLAGLAFVAVYREVFETVLFYAALWSQGDGAAILAGFAVGIGVLAVTAVLLLRYSARLPIARFFSISSIVIAVLAVVLAGKGVAALQEAGILSVHPVAFPRVGVLGMSPSMETVLTQAALALFAIGGFAWSARSSRDDAAAERPTRRG